jgi:hypothetical protein
MGLLAIAAAQRKKYETYRYFTHDQRWKEIQALFLEEATSLFHLSKAPMIENAL